MRSTNGKYRFLFLGLIVVVGLAFAFDATTSAQRLKRTKHRRVTASGAQKKSGMTRAHRLAPTPPPIDNDLTRSEGNIDARDQWFLFQRMYPFDSIPPDARRKAWETRPPIQKARAAQLALWQPIGPASTIDLTIGNGKWGALSGRINAIAVQPNNAQVVLIGTPNGGIWRSTDAGATFVSVADNQVDISVSSIAFSRSNPSVVYAGMGDNRGRSYMGNGVLKSTNAGQSWARVSDNSLPTPGVILKVAVDPDSPDRVYAIQDLYTRTDSNQLVAGGFYYSTNGGVSWTRRFAGLPRDFAIHPSNSQTLYLTLQRADQTPDNPAGGVFRSGNGGVNWDRVYTTPYDSISNIKVAVTAAAPKTVFLYQGGSAGGNFDVRVEVSVDGGANWSNRGPRTDIDSAQITYNNFLAVDPTNANVVYAGSRDLFKSTDGGNTFNNIAGNWSGAGYGTYTPANATTHSDQHSITFSPTDSNTIYLGNDGGLFKSADGGATLQSLNATLSLAQLVGYALHPTNAAFSYAGSQDNGNQKRQMGTNQWSVMISGDGGNCVIDQADPSVLLLPYINGIIYRFTNDGDAFDKQATENATFGEPPDPNGRIAFYPPLTGNGVNPRLYFGTWRLFVSDDRGENWMSPGGVTDLTKGGGDVLSTIGVSRSKTNVIYTGSSQGSVMVSQNGGANWDDRTAGLPNRSITSVTVSATDPATAYVTVSGFGSGHVFKTTTSGTAWTDISGNLPNIPANTVLIDPLNANTLYVGTDIGIFRSPVGGTTWETFSNGLPPVVVTKLVSQASGVVQAATYGRGAYQLQR